MAGMLLTSRPRQPVPTSRQLQQLTLSSLQQQRGCSLCQSGVKLADGRRRSGTGSRLLLCRSFEEEAGNAPSRLVFRGYSRLQEQGDHGDQEQLDTLTKNFNVNGFFLGHPVRRANNVIAKKRISISHSLRLLPKTKRQQTSYSRSTKSESKE